MTTVIVDAALGVHGARACAKAPVQCLACVFTAALGLWLPPHVTAGVEARLARSQGLGSTEQAPTWHPASPPSQPGCSALLSRCESLGSEGLYR